MSNFEIVPCHRQDTDFRYLTGCLQPDNVLVLGNFGLAFQNNIKIFSNLNFHYVQLFQLFHYLFYDFNIMFHLNSKDQ